MIGELNEGSFGSCWKCNFGGIVFSKNKEREEPPLLENPEKTSPGLSGLAFLSALSVDIISNPHDLFDLPHYY